MKYPLLGSPKIDGIRAIITPDGLLSRTGKRHANQAIHRLFGEFIGLDGELTFGEPFGPDVMNRAQSNVRAVNREGDFRFYVFDSFFEPGAPFKERIDMISEIYNLEKPVYLIPQVTLNCREEVEAFEEECLAQGYEGIMLRDPEGQYIFGRATARSGIIWKLKRFYDEEVLCVDLEEAEHNANEATTNALGYTERSSHKANKFGNGMVGRYICIDDAGRTFKVAPGAFTHSERASHWSDPSQVVGKTITHRHFGLTPAGAYRFSRAVSIREDVI